MLSKHESKMLLDAFKGLLSKVGGGSENPIRKIMRKQPVRPRQVNKENKYGDFRNRLKLISSSSYPTDYGRPKGQIS